MAEQSLKKSLINELAVARAQAGVNRMGLRQDMAVGRKLKNQLRANPVPWFTGAAVLGLLLSKLPPLRRKVVIEEPSRRKPKPEQMGKAGLAVAALNFVLQLAKPTLLKLLRERFTSSFQAHPRATRSAP